MKKYVAVILIALLALCGCFSDTPAPKGVMDFHVPDEFHGAWRCDEAELPDGSIGTEIIEITADDIGGIKDPFNQLLENYTQLAEAMNIPFDTIFKEEHPVKGYYNFYLIVYIGYDTVTMSGNLQLTDTGTLKVVLVGLSPEENFFETSEYYPV